MEYCFDFMQSLRQHLPNMHAFLPPYISIFYNFCLPFSYASLLFDFDNDFRGIGRFFRFLPARLLRCKRGIFIGLRPRHRRTLLPTRFERRSVFGRIEFNRFVMVRRSVAHTRIIRPLLRAGVLAFAFLICHCFIPTFVFFSSKDFPEDFNKFFRFTFHFCYDIINLQKNQKNKKQSGIASRFRKSRRVSLFISPHGA